MVAGMLGHSSTDIVGTYAKVVDEFRRRAIREMEKLRNNSQLSRQQEDLTIFKNSFPKQRWVN